MELRYEDYEHKEDGLHIVGETLVGTDGEYFRLERTSSSGAAVWTTELPVGAALEGVGDIIGAIKPRSRGYAVIREDGHAESGYATASDIIEYIASNPENVLFTNLPHENGQFTWSEPAARLIPEVSEVPFAEIGIVTRKKIGYAALRPIFIATATPRMSADPDAVFEAMRYEVKPIWRKKA